VKKQSTTIEWLKAIMFAFITIILFRIFFFEAFTIPSPSMEKSLLTGDYIVVSKLSYGARIPITPLSFPFVHQRLPFTENINSYLEWISIPYYRLFGSPKIKNNDVVVFNYPLQYNYPIDQRIYFVKRCVAVSGDTLEVRAGQVYINGAYNDLPEKLQFNYKVLTDNDSIDRDALKQLKLTEGGHMHNKGGYWFTLDLKNVEKIKKVPHVTSVTLMLEKKGSYSDYMFPGNEHFLWNVDFFGPIYIPKAGDSVKLNIDSLPLYERIISVYEKNKLRVSNDSIFINNKYSTHYTFKMNYFFMMGDSRHNSADSRFWGFLPEDHVVGKAKWILMSINKSDENKTIRWERWFKRIE
jgi:signal peptidase I